VTFWTLSADIWNNYDSDQWEISKYNHLYSHL